MDASKAEPTHPSMREVDLREKASTAFDVRTTIQNPPLRAYLASALTDLDEGQRREMFHAQDLIEETCKKYSIELYQPRKFSDPAVHKSLTDEEVFFKDREKVLESDVLIVMSHKPSFGAGQEMELARSALIPVVLVIPHGHTVSRMVRGMPNTRVELSYTSDDELRANLGNALGLILPVLLQRRIEFQDYDAEVVGQNIQRLREENNWSREELAAKIGVKPEEIRFLEEKPEYLSNPALLLLRKLSVVFDVNIPELVVPDYPGIVATQLVDLLVKTAVPVGGERMKMPSRDKRRVWARVMRRALHELEQE